MYAVATSTRIFAEGLKDASVGRVRGCNVHHTDFVIAVGRERLRDEKLVEHHPTL